MSKSTRQWARACLLVAGLAALAVGLTAVPAGAQVLYGSVVGTVTDPDGLRVPGASVVITNTSNGLTRDTTTNHDGEYSIVNVQPGPYDVRITMGTSFKEFLRRNVPVTQGVISRVDTKLETGSVKETLTVTSTSELLQTDKADTSTQLDSVQITALPLNQFRNYQSLIVLVPGTEPDLSTPNTETLQVTRTFTVSIVSAGATYAL